MNVKYFFRKLISTKMNVFTKRNIFSQIKIFCHETQTKLLALLLRKKVNNKIRQTETLFV